MRSTRFLVVQCCDVHSSWGNIDSVASNARTLGLDPVSGGLGFRAWFSCSGLHVPSDARAWEFLSLVGGFWATGSVLLIPFGLHLIVLLNGILEFFYSRGSYLETIGIERSTGVPFARTKVASSLFAIYRIQTHTQRHVSLDIAEQIPFWLQIRPRILWPRWRSLRKSHGSPPNSPSGSYHSTSYSMASILASSFWDGTFKPKINGWPH